MSKCKIKEKVVKTCRKKPETFSLKQLWIYILRYVSAVDKTELSIQKDREKYGGINKGRIGTLSTKGDRYIVVKKNKQRKN